MPGLRRGQRDQHAAIVDLVVQPDRRTPGLPGQPDCRRYVPGADDVIRRLAKYGGGGHRDGREPLVLSCHRDLLSTRSPGLLTWTKIVIIGMPMRVRWPDFS